MYGEHGHSFPFLVLLLGFVPSVAGRYLQLFTPVLRLLLAFVSTPGPQQKEARSQVNFHFVPFIPHLFTSACVVDSHCHGDAQILWFVLKAIHGCFSLTKDCPQKWLTCKHSTCLRHSICHFTVCASFYWQLGTSEPFCWNDTFVLFIYCNSRNWCGILLIWSLWVLL